MNMITSSQNPLVKDIKALKIRKNREESKEFYIEGERFIEEALKEKEQIKRVFVSESFLNKRAYSPIFSALEKEKADSCIVPDKLFREISDTENPQGIIAVMEMKQCGLSDFINSEGFVIILEALQDPGNMGTIIRTADAAGCRGIVVSKGCVDIYNPKVLRSTMGSIFHVPICFSDSLTSTIVEIKSKGFRVLGAHLSGALTVYEADMRGKTAIIIGNEANGMSDEAALLVDQLLKIPMPGRAESLNASVAAGILMYEAVRQNVRNIN